MSNIFSWIGQRGQRDTIALTRKHMDQVVITVRYLKEAVEAACAGQVAKTSNLHEHLSQAEHEADIIRRDLLAKLSSGMLLPPDRHDLVQLVSHMDDVADYALGASRILVIVATHIPPELRSDLILFADTLNDAVDMLAVALDALANGQMTQTLEACTRVENSEEEADSLKASFLDKLFKLDLPASTLLLMHNLIESMENTADRAEDSADLVRILAVSAGR